MGIQIYIFMFKIGFFYVHYYETWVPPTLLIVVLGTFYMPIYVCAVIAEIKD